MGIVLCRNRERSWSQDDSKTNLETEEYQTRIDLLYEIAQEASSVSEVSAILKRILVVAQDTVGASAVSLLLIDEEKDELYYQVALGRNGAALCPKSLILDSGITVWAVRNASPVVVNDVTLDSRFNKNADEVADFATKSIMVVPLIRGQKVIGVIEVLNKRDGSAFNERDLRVLKGVASTEALILLVSMAIMAIDNINSLALDEALRDGYKSTAEAWATAVDTKDPYGYAHSKRVREYALLAANYLSLSPEERQTIEFGALLHDIGKIGIDSGILCKPGPLTDEEWHIMYEHSLKGANIVGEIPFLEKAKDIVLHNHERYDGKGYPEGLKGNSIPIGARLVAVADAFDTMTTDHSYRAALSVDEAIIELIEGIGTQFCPAAVEAFISAFRKREKKLDGGIDPGAAQEKIESELEEIEISKPAKKEVKNSKQASRELKNNKNNDSEIYEGDIRLVVPLTVDVEEVRLFRKHLQKVENLKIISVGGSEEEGHIILISLQKPVALIRIIKEMPLIENVNKNGKGIIVTLKNPSS